MKIGRNSTNITGLLPIMPKAAYLNKLLQEWKCFDSVVSQLRFIKADKGNCVACLKLEEVHLNPHKGLHGGCSATLVDTVSGLGLMSLDTWDKPSISKNNHLTFMKSAKEGDEITIHSNIVHKEGHFVLLEVELRNVDNELLVKADHTKYKA